MGFSRNRNRDGSTRAAVVTGGDAGIGLAHAGWDVATLVRGEARPKEARSLIAECGARVAALAVNAAADRIGTEQGPIGTWVNNAMSTVVAKADRITPDRYARVTATTDLSPVHATLAALRHMKPRRKGAVVRISSGLGIRAAPPQAADCSAKAAVPGFTDGLRAELSGDGNPVRLSIAYLAVKTPQPGGDTGPAQMLHDPRLCAEPTLSAIRHGHRDVRMGCRTMQMALAQTSSPSFADRKMGAFTDAQMGEVTGDGTGELNEPCHGPARMDGPSTDRMLPTRQECVTSGQIGVKTGLAAGLVLGRAALGAAAATRRAGS